MRCLTKAFWETGLKFMAKAILMLQVLWFLQNNFCSWKTRNSFDSSGKAGWNVALQCRKIPNGKPEGAQNQWWKHLLSHSKNTLLLSLWEINHETESGICSGTTSDMVFHYASAYTRSWSTRHSVSLWRL